MQDIVQFLPHVNATLNSIATLLLLSSFFAIREGKIPLHRNLMFAALGVSVVFLASYLTYHANVSSRPFPSKDYPMGFAYMYWTILLSHVLLAVTVPILAIWAMILGLKDQREKHRKLVRWAFPIWVYVSFTGVIVYFLLYWIFIPKSIPGEDGTGVGTITPAVAASRAIAPISEDDDDFQDTYSASLSCRNGTVSAVAGC